MQLKTISFKVYLFNLLLVITKGVNKIGINIHDNIPNLSEKGMFNIKKKKELISKYDVRMFLKNIGAFLE